MARKLTDKNPLRALRNKNLHIILELLRTKGALSIPEIATLAGFSKMTVHKLLDQLLAEGIVADAGKGEAAGDVGKRPSLFAFNAGYKYVFAVKITNHELLTGITDLSGNTLSAQSDSFRADASFPDILRRIRQSFDSLTERQRLDAADCLGAVVGAHGIIDSETGVCVFSPHFMSWGADIPLKKLIGEALPDDIPVIVDNWLRFHAYAEMKTREGRGVRDFCILGVERDGLAGAVMLDGRIHRGAMGLAGEIGHMAVAPELDEVCACGGKHCFEVAVSPMRMEKRVRLERRKWPDSLLGMKKSPGEQGFKAILAAANRGDAFARGLLDGAAGYFATALNCVVQICDPGLVIIQGEYAAAGEYFITALKARLQELSLVSMRKKIDIEYSVLGADGFLFGASVFMADDLFRKIGEWTTDGIQSRLR